MLSSSDAVCFGSNCPVALAVYEVRQRAKRLLVDVSYFLIVFVRRCEHSSVAYSCPGEQIAAVKSQPFSFDPSRDAGKKF